MSAPLVPSPLDYVGRHKFVLFPPVVNAGPNEWLRGRTSWSQAQLINAVTGEELWLGWQYICGVSDSPDLDLVVELKEELEVRGDRNAGPRVKRIIPMPAVVPEPGLGTAIRKRRRRKGPAPVIGIRTRDEAPASHTTGKVFLAIAALLVLAGLVFRIVRL